MARRTFGGGRVLGNGRSLSPAIVAAAIPGSGNISSSPSSLSLTSQASQATILNNGNDQNIASRIAMESPAIPDSVATASASTRLVCPICNEEMVTLLQLNRHLDDAHKNLEEERQDEVKDWFKAQMLKAKRFQPLAVLNQKFKGLDVFESNATVSVSPSVHQSPQTPLQSAIIDPDELVTREHWQRHGPNDTCSDPACGKRLNVTNGSVNCRKCGKLFCEEHTMYQMKLSRSANHEPVRGFWCRVCETCYKSREGYNDHTGFQVDHTDEFVKLRRPVVDRAYLEVSRLEKRLTKLTQMVAELLAEKGKDKGDGGLKWPLAGLKNQRRQIEQSVITWEDDGTVTKCPFCHQEFNNYTFRRHHCRLCGRIVCGDARTCCSSEVALNVMNPNHSTEKSSTDIGVDVRMCKECKLTLFSKRDFAADTSIKPSIVRSYENLIQFEKGIRLMLPKFQRILVTLQDAQNPATHAQIADASKVRKRLMDSFTQYDIAARRIRDLTTQSEAEKRLQKAIHQRAASFLHIHMFPLKSLPKVLKHATPQGQFNGHLNGDGKMKPALAAIKYKDIDTSSQTSSSSVISSLEAEEKSLQDRLIVLEEQKFFVTEMVADANKRRKYDEVSTLTQNLDDLGKEIDQVHGMLDQLDFAGMYTGTGTSSPLPRA